MDPVICVRCKRDHADEPRWRVGDLVISPKYGKGRIGFVGNDGYGCVAVTVRADDPELAIRRPSLRGAFAICDYIPVIAELPGPEDLRQFPMANLLLHWRFMMIDVAEAPASWRLTTKALRSAYWQRVCDEINARCPVRAVSAVGRRPRSLTREEWIEIAAIRTQKAASSATGYDPKTIQKYFDRHGIVNPWKLDASQNSSSATSNILKGQAQ